MTGLTRYDAARPGQARGYYVCPHDPANPRHAAAVADHPQRIAVRQDALMTVITEFFDTRVFGPDRKAMLAAQIPATAAAITTRNHQPAQALEQRRYHQRQRNPPQTSSSALLRSRNRHQTLRRDGDPEGARSWLEHYSM